MKLDVERTPLNVIGAYAPQVDCAAEEKEEFWTKLEEVVESVGRGEGLVIGADLNRHVGAGNRGDEDVIGRHVFGKRNPECQAIVDGAKHTSRLRPL